MHQEHNVPWNKVASHLKFVRNDLQHTPRKTGLFLRNLQTQEQDVGHFTRVLSRIIATFSTTERAKFASFFDPLLSGSLFSDELCRRHPDYLNNQNRQTETWIARATSAHHTSPLYSTSHGDLADVVKILIAENGMSALLMLACHPQIPLLQLRSLSWGHHFGFSRVAESALQVYLFVNVIAAMDLLSNGEYLELPQYAEIVRELTMPMDYPAQQLPHRRFLDAFPKDPKTSFPALHQDLPRLHDYLKVVFCLLYRYDMLLRECSADPEWEREISECFRWRVGW